jgi:hypothetical protein
MANVTAHALADASLDRGGIARHCAGERDGMGAHILRIRSVGMRWLD